MKKFIFKEHKADIKFISFGKTIEELFENSANALFNIFYEKDIEIKKNYHLKAKGMNLENLLYDFLEKFIILFDKENFIPKKIKFKKFDLKKFNIDFFVYGDDAKDYNVERSIKAITYGEMIIKKNKNGYSVPVIVDV